MTAAQLVFAIVAPRFAAAHESVPGTKRQLPRIYDAGPLLGVERE
jgi:hypothetical protein